MRRWIVFVSALLAAATASAVVPAAAVATAPSCQNDWGSLTKVHRGAGLPHLTNVRAGRHTCFDRLVVDTDGKIETYWVTYVPEVTSPGSGHPVPLRGGAKLEIAAEASAHDDNYVPTYNPTNNRELANVTGWRTFRQIAFAGTQHGTSTIGLGVRARLPFRVAILDGPGSGSRLVIDVAHSW
jgi:hypothetical protein